jgi:hypothetical protein
MAREANAGVGRADSGAASTYSIPENTAAGSRSALKFSLIPAEERIVLPALFELSILDFWFPLEEL